MKCFVGKRNNRAPTGRHYLPSWRGGVQPPCKCLGRAKRRRHRVFPRGMAHCQFRPCLCLGSSTSFSPQWIVRVCLLDLLSHLEGPDIWKEPFPAVGIPRRLRKERWVLLFPRGMKGGHESWCSFTKEPIKWKQNTHVPRAKRKGGRGSGLWSVTA